LRTRCWGKYLRVKRNEVVVGGWRNLYNEQLHDLYCPPSMIRMIKPRRTRWAGHVARMEMKRNAYEMVGKPEVKRKFGKCRCRWEVDIK
jgi:hypothetical protein